MDLPLELVFRALGLAMGIEIEMVVVIYCPEVRRALLQRQCALQGRFRILVDCLLHQYSPQLRFSFET